MAVTTFCYNYPPAVGLKQANHLANLHVPPLPGKANIRRRERSRPVEAHRAVVDQLTTPNGLRLPRTLPVAARP